MIRKWLIDYDNPRSLGSRFRRRRMRRISEMLASVIADKGEATILDVGGAPRYWRGLPQDILGDCRITIVNSAFRDIDLGAGFDAHRDRFDLIEGDGCDLRQFPDDAFDLCHSNSVIEHVGGFDRMKAFAAETQRVGRRYYVQTPYLWFPIEPHYGLPFVHWLPDAYRARRLARNGLGLRKPVSDYDAARSAVRACELLDQETIDYLFPESTLIRERVGPFVKSLIVIGGGP